MATSVATFANFLQTQKLKSQLARSQSTINHLELQIHSLETEINEVTTEIQLSKEENHRLWNSVTALRKSLEHAILHVRYAIFC
jgi:predicted  nucleic acid-binding Zn-ribbon protein